MNALIRLRKDMVITGVVPFKYLLYGAMLSEVSPLEEDGVKYGVCSRDVSDLRDLFHEWGGKEDLFQKALEELGEEGLVMYSDDGETVFLGEFRGKRFFTFEATNSMADKALETLRAAIKQFKKSKSAITKSRARFIESQVDTLLARGIETWMPNDFTELHGFLYEVYTGGEVYNIRNKVEYFQTTNILKAYDKFTTFAIVVEGVLNFDTLKKSGIPTLSAVGYLKDEIFRQITSTTSSKEYMREVDDSGSF